MGKKKRRNEQTSKRVASKAGKQLGSKKTPKKYRGPIASALTQAPDKPKRRSKGKKK